MRAIGSVIFFLVCLLAMGAGAANVGQSKHNLSVTGVGTLTANKSAAGASTEICIFCHTPHSANSEMALWNRYDSRASYIPYSSSTLNIYDTITNSCNTCIGIVT